MYNPLSKKATEFIDHEETGTIEYAQKNQRNAQLTGSIIERPRSARASQGSRGPAGMRVAHKTKNPAGKENKREDIRNRIVLFAPLYFNYYVNGCVYCPYHSRTRIPRKKLTQEEIARKSWRCKTWP